MGVENLYDVGDQADLTYTLRNTGGSLANATSVTAQAILPGGAATTLPVVNPPAATGMYPAAVALGTAGRWQVRFTATGGIIDSETVALIVRPPAPVRSDEAYAGVDDVTRLCQGRTFTASSRPTVNDVVDWLALTAGEIDAELGHAGYRVPVATSATRALRYLAHGNALGAKALVEAAAPTGQQGADRRARDMYAEFRQALAAGRVELEAAKDPGQSRPRRGAGNPSAMIALTDRY